MPIDKTGYYPDGYSSEPESLRDSEQPVSLPEQGTENIDMQNVSQAETTKVSAEAKVQKQHGVHLHRGDNKSGQSTGQLLANVLSTFFSWVLLPLLMPVYGVILIFNTSVMTFTPEATKWMLTLVVFGINVVIPMLAVILLKRLGYVNDIGLNDRKERFVPYLICILCLGFTAYYVYSKGAPIWMTMFFAGGIVTGIVELIVNFKWKISVHAAGMAGIVALLARIWVNGLPMPSCLPWLITAIVLTGMLGSARIWLGRHTLSQVLAGYVVGFCGVWFMTMIGG